MSEAALRAEIPPHISPDEPTYPVYEKLKTIHGKLEKIEREKTHTMCVSARQQPGVIQSVSLVSWKQPLTSLRPLGACSEDLAYYREQLRAIDSAREGLVIAGHIDKEDPSKTVIPPGQAVCSDALAADYALLESLTDSAQLMSAAVRAIFSQLTDEHMWATAAQTKDVSQDELKRHQDVLRHIDAERLAHGGIFAGDASTGIPAGQAVLSELLAECFELLRDIQTRDE